MLTWLVCGVLAAAQGASVPASGSGRAFEVPYRLSDTQHIVVRAKLNGKGPYHFVVDTGAPALILSEAVGAEVGAPNGPGGWAELRSVEIEGGPVLRNVRSRVDDPFQLKTMNQTGLSEGRLAGVLGYTVLARYRMQIDLRRGYMVWTELDYTPQPPAGLQALLQGRPPAAAGRQRELEGFAAFTGGLLGSASRVERVRRGFLGVELRPGTVAEILRVYPESPAARAGLRAGDRIIALAGREGQERAIGTRRDLLDQFARVAEGEPVTITVLRKGQQRVITATTASRSL